MVRMMATIMRAMIVTLDAMARKQYTLEISGRLELLINFACESLGNVPKCQ